jgi:tetratricopeptide (TPR) repeat protein
MEEMTTHRESIQGGRPDEPWPATLRSVLPAGWPQDVPLVRLSTCGCIPITIEVLQGFAQPEHYQQPIYAPPADAVWHTSATTTALALLAYLVSQPRCYASHDALAQALRPGRAGACGEDDEDLEDRFLKRPENVVSQVRHLLYPPALQHLAEREQRLVRHLLVQRIKASQESGPGYLLAPSPLIWVDVEAMEMHGKQARLLEQFGESGVSEWQQASLIGLQGVFLPHERYSDWTAWRRGRVKELLWHSVEAQLQALKQGEEQHQGNHASLSLLTSYWQADETNEDAFRLLAEQLGKCERFQQAEEHYQRLCLVLEQEGREPHERTKKVIAFVRAKKIQRNRSVRPTLSKLAFSKESARPELLDEQHHASPLQERRLGISTLEGGIAAMKASRRYALRYMLGMTSSLIARPQTSLEMNLLGSVVPVFRQETKADETALFHLETITRAYWHLFECASSKQELLPGLSGHLRSILQLLHLPQSGIIRNRLSAVASETALIIGIVLFDMQDHHVASLYYHFAIAAAKEAGKNVLRAVGLGRLSFLPIYAGEAQQAIPLLQEANALLSSDTQPMLSTWLALLEAEALAHLQDEYACEHALRRAAEGIQKQRGSEEETIWTQINAATLLGYQGACYLQLQQPEKALGVLRETLLHLQHDASRHRSIIVTDMATAMIQLGEIEEACTLFRHALEITTRTKSLLVLLRLQQVRHHLHAWDATTSVKELDTLIGDVSPHLFRWSSVARSLFPDGSSLEH